jgi:basic membrane lipoprotein Med (substrate-binding protein (PBP1-ABC) superfamily)
MQKILMNNPQYKEWWYKRYIEKTYGAISEIAKQLANQGYRVIPLHHGYPVPDIIAIKDGNVYAVEVVSNTEQINPNKYINTNCFNDIWWIVYNKEVTNND